ncbi:hypothetical protein CEXT_97581 [Caerostris extrusa]|uniref:Ycf15 n=1 Tax=Caerostris extrusa TaxID=172846 RepID=A0AAV4XFM0_CAEEX|nr:hypothetical protein CEXT_97581 [Caerostris extrusa]
MSFKEVITSPLTNKLRLIFGDRRTANTLPRYQSLTLFGERVLRGSLFSKWTPHRMTKTKHSSPGMRDTMHSSELSQFHCAPTQNSLPHIRRREIEIGRD